MAKRGRKCRAQIAALLFTVPASRFIQKSANLSRKQQLLRGREGGQHSRSDVYLERYETARKRQLTRRVRAAGFS